MLARTPTRAKRLDCCASVASGATIVATDPVSSARLVTLIMPGSLSPRFVLVNRVDVPGLVRDAQHMPDRLAASRVRLLAALGFLEIAWRTGIDPTPRERSSGGCTRVGEGGRGRGRDDRMTAQGFDVELQQFPSAWRASFYPTGIAHSIVHGTAYEPTPWRAGTRYRWRRPYRRPLTTSR